MNVKSINLFAALLLASSAVAVKPAMDQVDWPRFMAEQDLVWNKLPAKWNESPFMGNGEQGTMIYKLNARTLRWDVGCSAAHDHRRFEDDDVSEKNVVALNRGRHFIGHMELQLPVDLTGGKSRLSLWDAEATGTLTAVNGSAKWSTLVHASEPVMRITLAAQGQLTGASFVYVPEEARSPRAVHTKNERKPVNPSAVCTTLGDGVHTAVHQLYAGGQTAVAWLEKEVAGTTVVWLSVEHSFPGNEATQKAVAAVRAAAKADQTAWVQSHRDWWHAYYPQSFVNVGDGFWDACYWTQQYKVACATRDKGWIIDNQGPWLQPTPWNALWWNLNIQLSHSVGYKANRRGMISAVSHNLDVKRDSLAMNVAEPYRADSYAIGRVASAWDLLGYAGQPGTGRELMDKKISKETGNLLWALHNVDLEYRYWQDTELRDNVLYPLLTRAVNYYRHFLVENDAGQLSLPETFSPEYRGAVDCTYDIDLLHWGVGRLLELAAEQNLNPSNEPLISAWKEIQAKLVPAHVDEKTGRMIGRNVKLTYGHRHWSHLLAIYPLRTLTPESPVDTELIERSLNHWHSFKGGRAGYSFTGGACIAAILGDGDRSLELLNGLKRYLKPNTFYSENVGWPVVETPLHSATAMHEMLLQSYEGRLRIFPAIPQKWTDIQFHQLRAEGAFLVSARREKSATKWVLVQSEAGGVVEVDPAMESADWVASENVKVVPENGLYSIYTKPGDWVMFWPRGQARPSPEVTPVARRGSEHHFGLK